jgi:nucleoside-diphosphate-sugar epimerase
MSDISSVVVTGSSGFIGARVVERLVALGISVIEIDAARGDGIDIRDESMSSVIPEGSAVVHLAALSTSGQCADNPSAAVDVNVLGSLNLWKASVDAGAKRFVFASTEWVYGNAGSEQAVTENADISLNCLTDTYAITKAAAESLLAAAPGDIDLAILRFGIVYGPRSSGWSAAESLLSAVANSDEVRVGSLRTSRRFIHVDDVAAAVVMAALGKGSYTVNIAGSRLVTLGEVIEVAQAITDKRVGVIETSPEGVTVRNPDPSLARHVLGWQPQIEFEQGLLQVAEHLDIAQAQSRG